MAFSIRFLTCQQSNNHNKILSVVVASINIWQFKAHDPISPTRALKIELL